MEPTTIILTSILVGKVADEILAKSKSEKLKKYVGLFSLIARIFTKKQGG